MDLKTYKKMPIKELRKIKTNWHQKIEEIDLCLQPDSLNDEYIKHGFHVYRSPLKDLLKALDPGYAKLYDNDILFSKQQDSDKLIQVLNNWVSGNKLIPPMLIDNGYDHLVPADGKHRMKISSLLDKEQIYFILFDVDLPKVNAYFTPELIS